jgi:hypothetical protein
MDVVYYHPATTGQFFTGVHPIGIFHICICGPSAHRLFYSFPGNIVGGLVGKNEPSFSNE